MDTYVECLAANGKKPEEGNIILGCWAIIAEDPEAEAERVGPHVLYQSNEYIRWGPSGHRIRRRCSPTPRPPLRMVCMSFGTPTWRLRNQRHD